MSAPKDVPRGRRPGSKIPYDWRGVQDALFHLFLLAILVTYVAYVTN